jgi:DNA-binding response OmpR family regulator
MDFPGLSIDTGTREVIVDGRQVEFTHREFDLLAQLATTPGMPFSWTRLNSAALRHGLQGSGVRAASRWKMV